MFKRNEFVFFTTKGLSVFLRDMESQEKRFIEIRNAAGKVAICAPEHFEKLNEVKWYIDRNGYAKTTELQSQGFYYMSVYVMVKLEGHVIPDGCVVDHKPPNNRLDNRPHMLQISTYAQNAQNRIKKKNSSTQYNGVFFISDAKKKYRTAVAIDGVQHYVGQYETEVEAARAYDTFLLNRPDFANLRFNLNFPQEKEELVAFEPYKKKQKKLKYSNVYKTSTGTGYMATLQVNNIRVLDDYRHTEKECAELVDDCVVKMGLNRSLNFPDRYPLFVPPKVVKTLKEDVDTTTVRILLKSAPEYFISIDRSDYERVMYGTICKLKDGYIGLKIDGKRTPLHRFLVDETNPKIMVDHIDNNPKNNKQNNLRRTNAKGNAENKSRKDKTIGVRQTKYGTYTATIVSGSFKYSKTRKTKEHALRDRDLVIIKNLPNSLFPLHFEWTQSDIDHWFKILHEK